MSSFIASAAPLRGRRIINNTTITENADAVLTDESVTIVCSFPDPSRAFIARIVPVADVIPGMIDTIIRFYSNNGYLYRISIKVSRRRNDKGPDA